MRLSGVRIFDTGWAPLTVLPLLLCALCLSLTSTLLSVAIVAFALLKFWAIDQYLVTLNYDEERGRFIAWNLFCGEFQFRKIDILESSIYGKITSVLKLKIKTKGNDECIIMFRPWLPQCHIFDNPTEWWKEL